MPKLDPKLKKKWVKALRSGDYEQGNRGYLRNTERDGTITYCCLGVLAEVQGCDLSQLPLDELGTDTLPHGYNAGLTANQRTVLAERNDGIGKFYGASQTFTQIADHIEENL